jgi:hypothetical protein
MSLNRDEARVAIAALVPRKRAIEQLLEYPILQLPEGIVNWEQAKQQLQLHHEAIVELENITAFGAD